ncbi:MAG: DUF420 domain-containing protein [Acidobacteria bacterium]|nr:DUF420 domain-containing protein [Acidobacteriota bacterium]
MAQSHFMLFSSSFIIASGVSLIAGYYFIRFRKDMILHRNFMISASVLAILFLITYVTRWTLYGVTPFEGSNALRVVYFSILVPHVILASLVVPSAAWLIHLALRRKDYVKHKRLARWVFPVWVFVAASGWIIYYMLHGRG